MLCDAHAHGADLPASEAPFEAALAANGRLSCSGRRRGWADPTRAPRAKRVSCVSNVCDSASAAG